MSFLRSKLCIEKVKKLCMDLANLMCKSEEVDTDLANLIVSQRR